MELTGALIAQLLIAFGPQAIAAVEKLIANWNKKLTPEEALGITAICGKSYEAYIAEAKADPTAL